MLILLKSYPFEGSFGIKRSIYEWIQLIIHKQNFLQRLEQNNLIEAYFTQLNASELGYQVTAFVNITLDKSVKNSDKEFKKAIEAIPQILECYSVSGEADYWLRVISENLPALSTFLSKSLADLPCVRDLTSTVVLNRVKHAPSIPLPN